MQRIPLTSEPNQTVFFTTTINGKNLSLTLDLKYINDTYWMMTVTNRITGATLLTNLPLVPAEPPYQNILSSFEYLQIGEAYIARTEETREDGPDDETLGVTWFLIWNDNLEWVDPRGLDIDDPPIWEV